MTGIEKWHHSVTVKNKEDLTIKSGPLIFIALILICGD